MLICTLEKSHVDQFSDPSAGQSFYQIRRQERSYGDVFLLSQLKASSRRETSSVFQSQQIQFRRLYISRVVLHRSWSPTAFQRPCTEFKYMGVNTSPPTAPKTAHKARPSMWRVLLGCFSNRRYSREHFSKGEIFQTFCRGYLPF
jgi:hypothetical protein